MWPPLIGQSVQVPTTRKHFAFRSEFRPLDILQLVFLTCFTFSTKETLPTLVGGPCWWFLCLFWVWFWVFVWVVCCWCVWLVSPINLQCFLSFYDDLGTPPTWRPHSWKKCWVRISLFYWTKVTCASSRAKKTDASCRNSGHVSAPEHPATPPLESW